MNTYSRMKDTGFTPMANTRQTASKGWIWGFATKIILISLLIFGAFFARVVFKAKTETLNKEAARLEDRIQRVCLENINLRNKRAALTERSSIMSKIGRLGLRAADYRQITRVSLVNIPGVSERGASRRMHAANGGGGRPAKADRSVAAK